MSSKSKMLNEQKNNSIQNEALKQKKRITFILKLIMLLLAATIILLVVLMLIDMGDGSVNYFNRHFLLAVCLSSVGVIAMILPYVTKSKFSDNKGDKMMPIVGIMLIVCAIISIFISYSKMV